MLFILLFLSSLHVNADARSSANLDSIRSAARSLSVLDRYRDAAETLKELDKRGCAQASDYLEMGKAYLAARDRGKAKGAFQKAIKHGAGAEGFTGVGLVYEDMGAHGHLALVNYRKALGKNPNHVEAQYHIAQIYRTLRPLDAEVAYRTTISMDGSHPDAYFQLGKLLGEEGRFVEARAAFFYCRRHSQNLKPPARPPDLEVWRADEAHKVLHRSRTRVTSRKIFCTFVFC